MITEIQIGEKSTNVLLVQMGTGDIMFNGIELDDCKYCLAFQQHEPRPIGSTTEEYNGKTTDDLPNPTRLVLAFHKPESITAVIHSLIELQKKMFLNE